MDQYSASLIAKALTHIGNALGQIAAEQKRANNLKEKESATSRQEALARRQTHGFG